MNICSNCKTEFEGKFCPTCGTEYTQSKFCQNCGASFTGDEKFCAACGAPRNGFGGGTGNGSQTQTTHSATEKATDRIKSKLYEFAGENDDVHIKLSDLFTNIWQKHNASESEEIFICGTEKTTPDISSINTTWPKPWLYSRIFAVFAIVTLFMFMCCKIFDNTNSLPGLFTLGAFAVPLTCLFFFFEVNAPRNISFFKMLKYFLVGGCASLLITLLLNLILTDSENSYASAILTSISEEAAKVLVAAIIIAKVKPKYRLNGIVIGAAVGAGFAAFESAGYAFNQFAIEGWIASVKLALQNPNIAISAALDTFYTAGFDDMVSNILLRGLLAPGGHVVWAAISGYAIVLARGDQPFSAGVFGKIGFWRLFIIPLVLHAVWDMPIDFLTQIAGIQIILTIASWVVMLVLISAGIKQVSNIANAAIRNQTAAEQL